MYNSIHSRISFRGIQLWPQHISQLSTQGPKYSNVPLNVISNQLDGYLCGHVINRASLLSHTILLLRCWETPLVRTHVAFLVLYYPFVTILSERIRLSNLRGSRRFRARTWWLFCARFFSGGDLSNNASRIDWRVFQSLCASNSIFGRIH